MKKLVLGLFTLAIMSMGMVACKSKPKDTDIKAAVETAVGTGLMVDVKEGVVTLSGTLADEPAKAAAEASAKAAAGVVSVVNNITVVPPPPPIDPELATKVATEVAKFKGAAATVNDGVVTLTGSIKRDDLPKLMQAIMALSPRKVDNQLTVK